MISDQFILFFLLNNLHFYKLNGLDHNGIIFSIEQIGAPPIVHL